MVNRVWIQMTPLFHPAPPAGQSELFQQLQHRLTQRFVRCFRLTFPLAPPRGRLFELWIKSLDNYWMGCHEISIFGSPLIFLMAPSSGHNACWHSDLPHSTAVSKQSLTEPTRAWLQITWLLTLHSYGDSHCPRALCEVPGMHFSTSYMSVLLGQMPVYLLRSENKVGPESDRNTVYHCT